MNLSAMQQHCIIVIGIIDEHICSMQHMCYIHIYLHSIIIVIGIIDEHNSSISVGTICATYTVYSIIIVIGIIDEHNSSIFAVCSMCYIYCILVHCTAY